MSPKGDARNQSSRRFPVGTECRLNRLRRIYLPPGMSEIDLPTVTSASSRQRCKLDPTDLFGGDYVQRLFSQLQCLMIGCALLGCSIAAYADSCVMFHKRAPVRAVCGKIINELGERPEGVKLTLATASGSSLFTAKTDTRGRFDFGPVPKGDYTLRATAPSYLSEQRPIRVTRDRDNTCKAMIEVKLGTSPCRGGIYVKNFDKESDLN